MERSRHWAQGSEFDRPEGRTKRSWLSLIGYREGALEGRAPPREAGQRNRLRNSRLFALSGRVPAARYGKQERLTRRPELGEATLVALRAIVDPGAEGDVLLWHLPRLTRPTLVLWGANDVVFPAWQAYAANTALRRGRLAVLPECGHMPHVERPAETAAELGAFLEATARNAFAGRSRKAL